MSQADQFYPLLRADDALDLHELIYGPAPWPYVYIPVEWDIPLGGAFLGTTVYAQIMATIYLCAAQWSYGTTGENTAVTTHHWVYEDEGDPSDLEWDQVEELMGTFAYDTRSYRSDQSALIGYRWYKCKTDGTGIDGETVRYDTTSRPGSTAALLPPQVSCAVTEVTAVRRRWGRFYIPFLATGGTTGRFSQMFCDTVAAAAKTMLEGVEGTWTPVVYGEKFPFILPILQVRVDDVPDIIRTRRWRSASYRAMLDL